MSKYLFVGGSKDGEWVDIGNFNHLQDRYIRIPVTKKFPIVISDPIDFNRMSIETETYRAEKFRGLNREFIIYVLEIIDSDELIEKLIFNYKKV